MAKFFDFFTIFSLSKIYAHKKLGNFRSYIGREKNRIMKFKFEQLGPLYEAEIELADLTIICGENNTGKTYVTNSLYALLFAWQQLLAWDLSEEDMVKLVNEGFINIDLQKEIVENWDAILKDTMIRLADNLHDFLATPP